MGVDGPATPAALYKMISIPEAQDAVLRETHPVGTASVPLHKAVGSVLSESVNARDDLPPFPASIKVSFAPPWCAWLTKILQITSGTG